MNLREWTSALERFAKLEAEIAALKERLSRLEPHTSDVPRPTLTLKKDANGQRG